MPQPYSDANLSELAEARVIVESAAHRLHPDSNAFQQTFKRERVISHEARRYQSLAIKAYLEGRYDAQNIRLAIQWDGLTVIATFTKGF